MHTATLGPALTTALAAVGKAMASAHDPWWIIASAAVALHGADPGDVADVDVLLSVADAERILPEIGAIRLPVADDPLFRSRIFARWDGTTLPVEFMADFHHRAGEAWVPIRPRTRAAVMVGGAIVFVPEAVDVHAMLLAFGRAKDITRARRLAAVIGG